jgi:hypothetical protein
MVDQVVEVETIQQVLRDQVILLQQTHLKETMGALQLVFQELVEVVQLVQDQLVRVQRVELEVQEHLTQF